MKMFGQAIMLFGFVIKIIGYCEPDHKKRNGNIKKHILYLVRMNKIRCISDRKVIIFGRKIQY